MVSQITVSIELLALNGVFHNSLQVDNHHELNCDKLSILFIWRRDYLAHPRNPSGKITDIVSCNFQPLHHQER